MLVLISRENLWLLSFFLATAQATTAPISGNVSTNASSIAFETEVLHYSYELERSWLDAEKRPCDNFFDFVCGRTLNGSVSDQILSQQHRVRQLQTQQKNFDKFLANESDEQLIDAEQKLKLFYMSCKEARSLDNLKSTLMYRNSGGWPAVDDTVSLIRKRRNITWLGVLSAFHDAGFEYFFNTNVEIKSNRRVVHLAAESAVRLSLRKFEQLASVVLNESAVDAGRARLVALEIMNFERNRREIAKGHNLKEDESSAVSYENFKLKFENVAAESEWDAYFKKILGKVLKPNDMVHLQQIEKMKKYFVLLKHTTITRFLNWIWIDYLMDKNITECQTLTRTYFKGMYRHIVEPISIEKAQMAQMYTELANSYETLLTPSVWIDEMSQQSSKTFYGRIMHLTLDSVLQLNDDLADLTITRRNFYRNLEKMQNHLRQQRKMRQKQQQPRQPHSAFKAIDELIKALVKLGSLWQIESMMMPLNYLFLGERFAKMMIASGGSSTTPGAWRSMESEREFSTFTECISNQTITGYGNTPTLSEAPPSLITMTVDPPTLHYNPNDMLLKILAQHISLHSLNAWQANNMAIWNRIDRLLSSGRLKLSLQKLYFISTLLANCHHAVSGDMPSSASNMANSAQRHFVHGFLRNSQEFSNAFGCHTGDELFSRNTCRVLIH